MGVKMNLMTGDGVSTTCPLGNNADLDHLGAPVIYKEDWGGNQLLYYTPRTNKILQSQTWGTTWAPTTASVASNSLAAPDGTVTADSLIEDSSLSGHYISQSVTTTAANYTFSVYIKAGTRAAILLLNGTTGDGSYFDLANGVLGDIELTPTGRSIVDIGGGWYRCTITCLCTAAANSFRVYMADAPNSGAFSYQGDGVSLVYLGHAQVELGLLATSRIITTTVEVAFTDIASVSQGGLVTPTAVPASGVILAYRHPWQTATVLLGVGNGVTASFQMLNDRSFEPFFYKKNWYGVSLLYSTPRTNLLAYSETFQNAAWVPTASMTVVDGAVLGPDGVTMNGASVTAGAASQILTQSLTIPLAATVGSIWVKRKTGTGSATIRDSNGTAVSITSASSTEWTRYSCSKSASTVPSLAVAVGVSGDAFYIACAQLEVKSAVPATAYIPSPTTSATVTDYSLNTAVTATTYGLLTLATAPLGANAVYDAEVIQGDYSTLDRN